ncbi:MAG TPA: uracil-DNA glycosylase [Candidatus Baltobacteraceae bacterium]|jgi:uracil-DNA glycosylase family 4|nr:uracil-DNA glycosylase [Candidatus Baltobacteraceae bacterium]
MNPTTPFAQITRRIIACERCPELRAYCAEIGQVKKRSLRGETYWAKPVPAFGDEHARVALVGLAPGAHGSNRTGRMFTGDASGVWLFRALYRAGFANQPEQRDRDDGLQLNDVLITAALRCAPPRNSPTPEQMRRCVPYLREELVALNQLRIVVGLGAIGTRAALDALKETGWHFPERLRFAHGAEITGSHREYPHRITLLASYHPSRQNTNTGVLTEPMFDAIFTRVREILEG